MYPDAASFGGETLDVSAAGALTSIDPRPDDEGVIVRIFFGSDQANAYTAMGVSSPLPDLADIGNRLDGTFGFTVTRYVFNISTLQYEATTDTATVTGKPGYAASIVGDNLIVYIAADSTSQANPLGEFYEGGANLFDFSSLGGDITDSSVLNNFYVAQATYTPPAGFTGTVTATASEPTLCNPGPS